MKSFVKIPRKWKYVKIPISEWKTLPFASDEVEKSSSDETRNSGIWDEVVQNPNLPAR